MRDALDLFQEVQGKLKGSLIPAVIKLQQLIIEVDYSM